MSMAAVCRSFVGLQTVSRNRTSDAGKRSPNERDHATDLLDRLRGLRGDADPWMFVERQDVVLVQDHVEAVEIAGEAAHFDVVALPDDHDVIPVPHQRRDGAVRDVHERARGLDDGEPERARARQRPLGTCRAPSP